MFLKNLFRGYCIIPLPQATLQILSRAAHRKTRISISKKTETHTHKLFSFYMVENMNILQTPNGEVQLPQRALVIVLPFALHGWSNESGHTEDCFVYDLSPFHKPHVILN